MIHAPVTRIRLTTIHSTGNYVIYNILIFILLYDLINIKSDRYYHWFLTFFYDLMMNNMAKGMLLLCCMQFIFSMFKKIGYIIISFLLFTVILGITVNLHYCGDRLFSLKIFNQADKCCDNNQCGHCKDESVRLEINEDFLPVLDNGLISEIFPFQLLQHFSNDISLLSVHAITTLDVFASDISPPGVIKTLSLLQTYLL